MEEVENTQFDFNDAVQQLLSGKNINGKHLMVSFGTVNKRKKVCPIMLLLFSATITTATTAVYKAFI